MTSQTTGAALAPCPFCGGTPEVAPKNPKAEGDAWGAVRCVNFDCATYDGFRSHGVLVRDGEDVSDQRGSDAYKAAAVARWNRRAVPLPTQEGGEPPMQGKTAYDIIRESNLKSADLRAGIKDRSREPLLGPPDDMTVSRVILAERPEITAHDADLLAVKINDALTPAHPIPGEGVEALREACARMAADYQTSEGHHPDHVLIRKADFDSILQALSISTEAGK